MLFDFLPYQKRWIQDDSQIKLMEKSRQIGISWATAYSLVDKILKTPKPQQFWVASSNMVQAKLLLEDCKQFANKFLEKKPKTKKLTTVPSSMTSLALTFDNKSQIQALSSNPNAQAGKRGTRILDEFALHSKAEELYGIAYPGITWGGQLQIISTHRGSDNYFNKLIKEVLHSGNPKKISHHKVTLQDALDQGFLKKLKTILPKEDPRQEMDEAAYYEFIRKACPSDVKFLEEYMCQPTDDETQFLNAELITQCEYPEGVEWEIALQKLRHSNNDLYMGIDVGRMNDFTVFWLIECVSGIYFTRHVRRLKKCEFATQEKVAREYTILPNLRRICVDATALGCHFSENLVRIFSRSVVEGVNFNNGLNSYIAHAALFLFEKKKIYIPPCDIIRADLMSLKRQMTSARNVRLSSDGSSAGHADHFWALALAIYAADAAAAAKEFNCEVFERQRRQYYG